jgi:hypothetical protein
MLKYIYNAFRYIHESDSVCSVQSLCVASCCVSFKMSIFISVNTTIHVKILTWLFTLRY